MNTRIVRFAGFAAALVLLGAVCIRGLQAQQVASKPAAASITTNWVGCLVVGQNDALDRIARGPYPAVVRQVEIGLRSDGVVVWRSALQPHP
jgi:hypothetical protein